MPELLLVLLKINSVLLLFAAAYYLVLRRLTFYSLNRLFLMFGILFSSLYPFIDLTEFFHQQVKYQEGMVALVPALNGKVSNFISNEFIFNYWDVLVWFFYAGVLVFGLRLAFQFYSLYRIHRQSIPGALQDYPVRILKDTVSPFSFWRTIYINPSLHQQKEISTILAHEEVHVKQWHSIDILLAELSVVFYWFNPGVWLMKKAVKENLEFITDERILKKGVDRKTYQYSLLGVGQLEAPSVLVNNFNLSDLKKRILMMNVKRSSRLTLSRYLLLLPLLLLITLSFTVTKKEIKEHLKPIQEAIAQQTRVDIPAPVQAQQVEQPKHIAVTVNSEKLNNKTEKVPVKKESTARKIMSYVIGTIYINTDTMSKARFQGLEKEASEKLQIAMATEMLEKLQRDKGDASTADSIVFKKISSGDVKNVIRLRGVPSIPKGENGKAVVSYTIKSDSGFHHNTKIRFILNGKEIAPEELKNIPSDEVKSVIVRKNNIDMDEVIVTGRKKL